MNREREMIRLTPDATSRTASHPGSQRMDTAEVAGNSRTSLRRDALRPGTGRGSMPDARPSGASDSRARVVPQSSISARPQRISRRFREATDVDSIRGRSESVGTSGAGESRVHSRPIPTGLRPPAQGCAARATLGTTDGMKLNPNGVEPCSPVRGHNPVGVSDIGPRVARGAQPWALGRNPVGIRGGRTATQENVEFASGDGFVKLRRHAGCEVECRWEFGSNTKKRIDVGRKGVARRRGVRGFWRRCRVRA
jgi:hypothetical protein